jgi:dolichyl-phosphate-mannose-protein mannosyltransferase
MHQAAGRAPVADRAATEEGHTRDRRSRVWPALAIIVLLASCAVRFIGLGALPGAVFDEHYYVPDAKAYLRGDIGPGRGARWQPAGLRSLAHPPLGVLSIAAGIAVLDNGPFGWRVTSALAGALLLALVYPTARRLGLRPPWALVALVLAAADPLLVAQSRIAMLDVFLGLWTVASVYLALRYAQCGRAWPWLWLCGLAVGAALATKWSGALTLLAVLMVITLGSHQRTLGRLARDAGVLAGVAAGAYLLSYLPYFAAGHGPTDWLAYQRHMLAYGWTVQSQAGNTSSPISWIFDLDPLWYRWALTNRGVQGFVAIGNPLVWWGAIGASIMFAVAAVTRRDRSALIPLLLVAILYLPWLLTHRATYFYYMVPVVPYLAILVALGLQRVATARPRLLVPAVAYVVLCVALGIAWLPFAMGGHASYSLYQALTWLPSWK